MKIFTRFSNFYNIFYWNKYKIDAQNFKSSLARKHRSSKYLHLQTYSTVEIYFLIIVGNIFKLIAIYYYFSLNICLFSFREPKIHDCGITKLKLYVMCRLLRSTDRRVCERFWWQWRWCQPVLLKVFGLKFRSCNAKQRSKSF